MKKAMKENESLELRKAENGYIVTIKSPYGSNESQTIAGDFIDAVTMMAEACNEAAFVATLRENVELSKAMEGFFSKIMAPKLLALEAKVNPGVENVVNADEIPFN